MDASKLLLNLKRRKTLGIETTFGQMQSHQERTNYNEMVYEAASNAIKSVNKQIHKARKEQGEKKSN